MAHPPAAPPDLAVLRSRAAAEARHPLRVALLSLTLVTGIVDAVSFLGLGRVFAANMTGNVVLLGFGVAGQGGLPVLAPIVSLGAFLLGARCGGALAERFASRHLAHVWRAWAAETLLIVAAIVVTIVFDVRAGRVSGAAVIGLLALSMGLRNATVGQIGVPDLTTTVLTRTLTALAADPRSRTSTLRRFSGALAMFAGAVAGALLLTIGLQAPLIAAAALTMATWLLYPAAIRRLA